MEFLLPGIGSFFLGFDELTSLVVLSGLNSSKGLTLTSSLRIKSTKLPADIKSKSSSICSYWSSASIGVPKGSSADDIKIAGG